MRYPFFGISPDSYSEGKWSSVAMSGNGAVVSIHESVENKGKKVKTGWLMARVGQVEGTTLRWLSGDKKFDDGFNPAVAVTDNGVVLEVHDSGGISPNVWYTTGRLSGNTIDWKAGEHKKYDGGRDPTVAVNKSGVVVEVHSREVAGPLFWSVGKLDGTKMKWTGHDKKKFDDGYNPSIAINSSGLVVEMHDSGMGKLWYWIGQVKGDKIEWIGHEEYDSGVKPSVSLTDDGHVFEMHQAQAIPPLFDGTTLWQRYGKVNGKKIEWLDVFGNGVSNYVDDGIVPAIASNGKQAVHTHSSENFPNLHADASLVIDRASWMQDHLGKLGGKTLREIAVPASHDAGMYLGGFSFSTLGKTQDLSIFGQLKDGVRYFDLRPQYKSKSGEIVLHHGSGVFNVEGAKLADVLDQIARFMKEGHRELAMFKFSHYEDFTQDGYTKMCNLITQKVGTWLYAGPPAGRRLADVPLNDYLATRGTALMLFDKDGDKQYAFPPGAKGLYVYREWSSEHAAQGDLVVFDIYSDTMDFDVMAYSTKPDKDYPMVPRGQLPKFNYYNGKCLKVPEVTCDLFLLSWTLTPPTAVWTVARLADKHLVDVVGPLGKNPAGLSMNLLYLDYVEYARATDLCLLRNGLV